MSGGSRIRRGLTTEGVKDLLNDEAEKIIAGNHIIEMVHTGPRLRDKHIRVTDFKEGTLQSTYRPIDYETVNQLHDDIAEECGTIKSSQGLGSLFTTKMSNMK